MAPWLRFEYRSTSLSTLRDEISLSSSRSKFLGTLTADDSSVFLRSSTPDPGILVGCQGIFQTHCLAWTGMTHGFGSFNLCYRHSCCSNWKEVIGISVSTCRIGSPVISVPRFNMGPGECHDRLRFRGLVIPLDCRGIRQVPCPRTKSLLSKC